MRVQCIRKRKRILTEVLRVRGGGEVIFDWLCHSSADEYPSLYRDTKPKLEIDLALPFLTIFIPLVPLPLPVLVLFLFLFSSFFLLPLPLPLPLPLRCLFIQLSTHRFVAIIFNNRKINYIWLSMIVQGWLTELICRNESDWGMWGESSLLLSLNYEEIILSTVAV